MEVGVVHMWGRCEEVILRLKEPWRPPPLRVLRRCLKLQPGVRLFWRYSETQWVPVDDQQGLIAALALSAEQRLYAVYGEYAMADCVRRVTRRNHLAIYTNDVATDVNILDALTRQIPCLDEAPEETKISSTKIHGKSGQKK